MSNSRSLDEKREIRTVKELQKAKNGIVYKIPLRMIVRNDDQPRLNFDEEKLQELANSISVTGDVRNPIWVRKEKGRVMIIDGERRWRACKKLDLESVSCLVRSVSSVDVFEESVIANFGDEDMNVVEAAHAFARLMREKGLKQAEIARRIGKSQGHISNIMKVLQLHPRIQKKVLHEKVFVMVKGEKIDIGVGIITRIGSFEPDKQEYLLDFIMEQTKKRGRPIHPNEAIRLLRGKAEKEGIGGNKSQIKRRKSLSHAALTCNALLKTSADFKKILSDFSRLGNEHLMNGQRNSLFNILTLLQEIQTSLEKQVVRLDEIAD